MTAQQTISLGPTPRVASTFDRLLGRLGDILSKYSIDALRISLGLVFLGFGVLKFFPGVSPAQDLAIRTVDALTLGTVSGSAALYLTAAIETFIGLTLVTGRFLRIGLTVLTVALVGILSPVVLFFEEMFSSGPTLAAQYVLKDIVLASGGLVVGAKALGGRLTL